MRALISVSDKTGLVELAEALRQLGFDLLSTGGTTKKLREAEISVQEVSELTGFPEILGGRVKTLHPKIFGGILYDRKKPSHQSEIENCEISAIDWVVVNLYPFEKITLEDKISKEEMLEFIDIGGASLLRAAAKNFKDVVALCKPSDYPSVLEEYKQNQSISLQTKKMLAEKAFAHTACYDSMIAKFFRDNTPHSSHTLSPPISRGGSTPLSRGEYFPTELSIGLKKICALRYGENPQQKAALYKQVGERDWGITDAEKLQGKELSFNNYLDLDSAWQIVNSISSTPLYSPLQRGKGSRGELIPPYGGEPTAQRQTCCVIVKHTNPCGAAMGKNSLEAFQLAYGADSLSAFGGIVGFSSTVDEAAAQEISKSFFECIIAPEYENKALEIFKKKPNLRILKQPISLALPYELDLKKISGGMLLQERDWEVFKSSPESSPFQGEDHLLLNKEKVGMRISSGNWRVVTKRSPTPEEFISLQFAWQLCRFVKSNAIVLARGTVSCGIGAGQMSRIDSLRIAIEKMNEARNKKQEARSENSNPPESPFSKGGQKGDYSSLMATCYSLPLVMASDAFFPFRDCVDEAAKAGISAIIQPGASIRDRESIEAANQHNIAMIFTSVRHFKH